MDRAPSEQVEGAEPAPAASVVYLLKQLELSVRSRLDEVLTGSGLTVVQYTALSVFRRWPATTGAELARRWHITPQATSEVITSLERLGLIERRTRRGHGRRLSISLTPRGFELLEKYDDTAARLDSLMMRSMSPAAQRRFRRDLVEALRNLDAGEGGAGHA